MAGEWNQVLLLFIYRLALITFFKRPKLSVTPLQFFFDTFTSISPYIFLDTRFYGHLCHTSGRYFFDSWIWFFCDPLHSIAWKARLESSEWLTLPFLPIEFILDLGSIDIFRDYILECAFLKIKREMFYFSGYKVEVSMSPLFCVNLVWNLNNSTEYTSISVSEVFINKPSLTLVTICI